MTVGEALRDQSVYFKYKYSQSDDSHQLEQTLLSIALASLLIYINVETLLLLRQFQLGSNDEKDIWGY